MCGATETPLEWPDGPSDAYITTGNAFIPDQTGVTVASLALPMGRFVVSATATAGGPAGGAGSTIAICSFDSDAATLSLSGETNVEPGRHETVPILGRTVANCGPTTLDLVCRARGSNVSVDAFVIATQVGTFR